MPAGAGIPLIAGAGSWPASGSPRHTLKWNVLPMPFSLSTSISPPIISTSFLLMLNPRPVPPYFRVVELSACENAVKSRAVSSGSMPIPVSRTEKCRTVPSARRSPGLTESSISPRSVNLTAFDMRFRSTCPSRSGSPFHRRGMPGGTRSRNSSPLSETRCPIRGPRLASTSSRSKSTRSMEILPASIFEKSRISLMMPSSEMPAPWILAT